MAHLRRVLGVKMWGFRGHNFHVLSSEYIEMKFVWCKFFDSCYILCNRIIGVIIIQMRFVLINCFCLFDD